MNAEYVRALERQLSWARFHERFAVEVWTAAERDSLTLGGDSSRSEVAHAVREGIKHAEVILASGDVYYLAAHIQRMALRAAETLPDVSFTIDLLPSKHGFVVLQEPLELARDLLNVATAMPMYAKVIGWRSGLDPRGVAVCEFMFFTDGVYADHHGGYWPLTYFGVSDGDTWQEKQTQYEHTVLSPVGEKVAASKPHEVAFIYSLLLLLNQHILAARVEHPDRAQRRRSSAAGRIDHHVKVITLRRYAERAPSSDEDHKDVEWSCQWLVRGHWRQQPYGPGKVMRRPIWIAPYTKGPDGKPFKDDDARRIFAAVR